MEFLHLDNIEDSTVGTMHLLSFINYWSVFPSDIQIEDFIEEICNACNAKRVISTKHALAEHRTVRYDRIWLLTEDNQDAAFLYLRYGSILDLSAPRTEFTHFYKLFKGVIGGTKESLLMQVTMLFRHQKKEKLGVI